MIGNGLLTEVLDGRMLGKISPGRPRILILNKLFDNDMYKNVGSYKDRSILRTLDTKDMPYGGN